MKYYSKEVPDPDVTECFSYQGGLGLMADFFLPDKNNHKRAAVIFIHGGGWNAGNREEFSWHAHRLSIHGYVACTIDYRLSDTATFPAAVQDCQSAVKWLRKNADRFDIRSDRIGAVGSSAGGHLAACLGVLDNKEGKVSSRVNCVVDIHGVNDFVSIIRQSHKIDNYLESFLGVSISKNRDLRIAASPALHVDGDSAPMLLVHDPKDDTVPYDQSLILANALIKAGRPMRFMPCPDSGHGFIYDPQNKWTQQVWPVAVAWLDYYLLGITFDNLFEEES